MFDSKQSKIVAKDLKKHSIILGLVWSALIIAIFLWDFQIYNIDKLDKLSIYANVSLNKDILYQKWTTLHSDIYVPVTKDTIPNLYLADTAERHILTPSTKKLTLITSTYMSKQVNELELSDSNIHTHITSLNPKRVENAPDDWEKKALESFELGKSEVVSIDTINGLAYYRFMRPFITEQGCLKCHANDGYKLNEIIGGISISYPMDVIDEIFQNKGHEHLLIHIFSWIIGIGIIIIGYIYLRRIEIKRSKTESVFESTYDEMEQKIKERTTELSKAKKNWENIFQSIGSPAQIIDTDYKIIHLNDATLKISNIGPDKFIGKKCHDLFLCSSAPPLNCLLKSSIELKKTVSQEIFIKDLKKHFIVSITPLIEDNGEIEQLIHIMTDITDRKVVEAELQKSEFLFKELLKSAPDAIVQVDTNGSILFLNEQTVNLFGYDSDELLGKSIEQLIPEALKDVHRKHRKKYEKYPTTRSMGSDLELIAKRKDNTELFVEVSLSCIKTDDEIKITAIIRDITSRKKAEEILLESKEFFRKTLDLGVVGMATTNPYTFKFLSANNRLCEMLGYTEEELLKKTWQGITFPKEKVGEDIANAKKLLGGEIVGYVMEKQYKHKDGHLIDITLSVQGVRKKDGSIDYFITLIDDITKRKEYEKKINRLNVDLEKKVKDRTLELESKNRELERMNKLFVGRELRMKELKKIIEELEKGKNDE
jgi:PAS domain S-box-containing protein